MMCTVYDNIFSGFNQPTIGVFTLPIGELMDDLYAEQTREKLKIREILDEMTRIVENAEFQPQIGTGGINETQYSDSDQEYYEANESRVNTTNSANPDAKKKKKLKKAFKNQADV